MGIIKQLLGGVFCLLEDVGLQECNVNLNYIAGNRGCGSADQDRLVGAPGWDIHASLEAAGNQLMRLSNVVEEAHADVRELIRFRLKNL